MNSLFVSSKIIMMLFDFSLLQNSFFQAFLSLHAKMVGGRVGFYELEKSHFMLLKAHFTLNKRHVLQWLYTVSAYNTVQHNISLLNLRRAFRPLQALKKCIKFLTNNFQVFDPIEFINHIYQVPELSIWITFQETHIKEPACFQRLHLAEARCSRNHETKKSLLPSTFPKT